MKKQHIQIFDTCIALRHFSQFFPWRLSKYMLREIKSGARLDATSTNKKIIFYMNYMDGRRHTTNDDGQRRTTTDDEDGRPRTRTDDEYGRRRLTTTGDDGRQTTDDGRRTTDNGPRTTDICIYYISYYTYNYIICMIILYHKPEHIYISYIISLYMSIYKKIYMHIYIYTLIFISYNILYMYMYIFCKRCIYNIH